MWRGPSPRLTWVIYIFVLVSLKWPIATKREMEIIERVRSKIAEKDRFFKTLLDFKNLFKAGLISEPEYARRKRRKRGGKVSNVVRQVWYFVYFCMLSVC